MDLGLAGKVAIITGGSEGIGRAAAESLGREGASVAICARRPDVLQRAAEDVAESTGAQVLPIVADVSRAADNIRVNGVMIGLIKSGQHERTWRRSTTGDTLEALYAQMGKGIPLGRVGEASEVGDLIAFLCSARGAYITGVAINMDGGTSAVV